MNEAEAKRNELIEEIRSAFKNVDRKGGTSWRDAAIEDHSGLEYLVKYRDLDNRWEDLLEMSDWRPDAGVGGWVFLDPIGVRYYLPAAMIRTLNGDEMYANVFSCIHQGQLSKFERLDDRQRRCVARFLLYMDVQERAQADGNEQWEQSIASEGTDWLDAYKSDWSFYSPA